MNIKILCYFNSHKQMEIMESCFKHPSVNFPVFLIKDMELIPITWTYQFSRNLAQDSVLIRHICKILNKNSWIIPEGIKTSAVVKKSCISIKRIHSHYKEMEIVKDQLVNKLI